MSCQFNDTILNAESRVLIWQARSSLPPVNLAGLPAPEIYSCLLTPSGQMLFLSSKTMIRVLWVKHQRPVPGIAISSVLTSHGGARWSQPHASGSGTLLIGEGGELVVPDHSAITSMTTDPSELHLLASTSSLSLLVWDLSRAGFSRHVIYQEPPVQVRLIMYSAICVHISLRWTSRLWDQESQLAQVTLPMACRCWSEPFLVQACQSVQAPLEHQRTPVEVDATY